MRGLIAAASVALAVAGPARAAGGAPGPVALLPRGSTAIAGSFTIDLGEADDAEAPTAWQGPLKITRTSGGSCTVSDEVSIIEEPLSLVGGHVLYVSTYSGSESILYAVDADDCTVKWTSPRYVGKARISATALRLPGHAAIRIAPNGMPASS